MESIREAKEEKKALKLPVLINLGTGKESACHVAFSHVGWNEHTGKYLKSINSIDKPTMDGIVVLAKQALAKQANLTTPDCDGNNVGGSLDDNDKRANIAEGSGSSGDEDDGMDEDGDL